MCHGADKRNIGGNAKKAGARVTNAFVDRSTSVDVSHSKEAFISKDNKLMPNKLVVFSSLPCA
jgi:hypothetical protein